MARKNCELELEIEFTLWKSSRYLDGLIEFNVRRGHIIEMRMKGLLWSIEALPLPNTTHYTFSDIDLKRSKSPLHLSPKFKLLLLALQTYIRSVDELLDKLYAYSRFLSRAENEKRWWIIVDPEIMAMACNAATEATQQAAKVAASFLAELLESLEFFPRQSINTEELWATTLSATEIWNGVAQAAVDGGNVLQWCKVQVLEMERLIPCFEFEVAVQEFLQGNDEISKIGLVNRCALKVSVGLEEEIRVVCSQEGVETETSLGLSSLLPQLIKNYITSAPERNEGEDGVKNIVEGLLQRVVGYLTFLPRVCEVCGSHRLVEVSLSSSCSDLCEARKEICGWNALRFTQQGLSTLLLNDDDDVDDGENENAEDLFN